LVSLSDYPIRIFFDSPGFSLPLHNGYIELLIILLIISIWMETQSFHGITLHCMLLYVQEHQCVCLKL